MSQSTLKDKWMRKQYGKSCQFYGSKTWEHNPHHLDEVPKNYPSRYVATHCSADIGWLQEPTSFGGHSISKGGHRHVSGLIRASVKREVARLLDEELNTASMLG